MVYGNLIVDFFLNAPEACENLIILTHYFDANMMHDMLSVKAITGIIHSWNKGSLE